MSILEIPATQTIIDAKGQGNEKSHPRNQQKPWNHNDSEAFFVAVRYQPIGIYSHFFGRLFVGNKSPFRINNVKIISKAS